jgi:phosphoribosylamine--glycine ligase
MLTEDGPKLIEFNVRLGDPEAQALLPRLDGPIAPLLLTACDGGLAGATAAWRPEASVAVVLAGRGYPGEVSPGAPIGSLDAARAVPGVCVYHGATGFGDTGGLVAAGGRVLTVQALAPTLAEARAAAYRAVDAISFPGGFCRRDIGA